MKTLAALGLLFFSSLLSAQLQYPKASPTANLIQEVGLTTIEINYSRPAVKGRTIFGDLVPYGRIWRVGANASTKITIDSEVDIMGNLLLPGTYALYAFPEANEWQIVFHKNIEHWGDGRNAYDSKDDAFRILVKPEIIPYLQENFHITFDHLKHDSVQLLLIWERTKISIPLKVDTHAQMLKEINEELTDNPTAQSYYEAARYLQEQGADYETSLVYLNKAIQLEGDTYYFHRVKSLVEAALLQYDAAIRSAKKSLELAEKQGKDEFVRMNQKNIEAWNILKQK